MREPLAEPEPEMTPKTPAPHWTRKETTSMEAKKGHSMNVQAKTCASNIAPQETMYARVRKVKPAMSHLSSRLIANHACQLSAY